MEYRHVIIETDRGNKIAIINTLEDGIGLGEIGVRLMILRDNAEALHKAVTKLKRSYYRKFGKKVDGIMSEWIPTLITQGLLIEPTS
jgi:hypothetical protein